MKLAIMQPYIFPYPGYFQLMQAVDKWVVFDDIQYIDKGWINRNRILHPDIKKEWQYFTIPLRHRGQFDKIREIQINQDIKWKQQILGKLSFYKKSPYYKCTIEFVSECLENDSPNLTTFVTDVLKKTRDYLKIDTEILVQSKLSLELGSILNPGQWALNISKELGAKIYINPFSGFNIFSPEEYAASKISLLFLRPKLDSYYQNRPRFVPNLSILDMMMWENNEYIRNVLSEKYELVTHDEINYG